MAGVRGLTPQGFVPPTLTEIREELEADFRGEFGASIDLDPRGPFGQVIGIHAERIAELWEGLEEVNASQDPAAATGIALDNLSALTGTRRKEPTRSRVSVTCSGAPATVLPAGRVLSVKGTGAKFRTEADATIGPGGTVAVPCEAVEVGPIVATAGTLTVIETPVSGWTAATNPLDADLGTLEERDPELSLRREQEIRAEGNAAVDAISGKVLKVKGVTAATTFENPTATTSPDGIPPYSIEVMVQGGEDLEVAQTIFGAKAGGVRTHGTSSAMVLDRAGDPHLVKYTRPEELAVFVAVDLEIDPDLWPEDGADQVKAAIVKWGDARKSGEDIVASALIPSVFKVSGVLDSGSPKIGTAPAPASSARIPVTTRQLAIFDSSRITVTTTPGSL